MSVTLLVVSVLIISPIFSSSFFHLLLNYLIYKFKSTAFIFAHDLLLCFLLSIQTFRLELCAVFFFFIFLVQMVL